MLKIQEIAAMFQIQPNVIRFYEKKGLLKPKRGENGYRYYGENDIEILQLILLYRTMNFSIENIRKLLSERDKASSIELYFQHFQVLNRHIHSLSKIRDGMGNIINLLLANEDQTDKVHEQMDDTAQYIQLNTNWKDVWNFDSWASRYDEVVNKAYEEGIPFYVHYEEVLDRCTNAVLAKQGNVLEIGIGTGNLAGRIIRKKDITGVDQSIEMLLETKKKYPELPLYYGTFLELPFEQASFDTIVSSYAFHHCTEKEKELAIKEMKRVLRSEGIIIIADVMFINAETRNVYEASASRQEKMELHDEFFAHIDTLSKTFESYGFSTSVEQIDDLLWIFVAEFM